MPINKKKSLRCKHPILNLTILELKVKKSTIIISLFIFFAQIVFAQTSKNNSDELKDVSVKIKYYNKSMYYPENAETNPIFVHISIKNNGTETMRFKLADDRTFSLDFNVYSIQNKILEQTENIKMKRTTDQTVYFREIALETGEEYSFVENLKDYVKISEPSIYYFDLQFYPELYKSKYKKIISNRLTLEINPELSALSSSFIPVTEKTATPLVPQEISPDKVVEQTIVARQKSLWDQYFLYMDIESMIQKNASTKRKYNASNAEERARMLKNFKADLMQNRIENDIVAVPEEFEIEKTVYTQTEGTVTVTEWFKYPNFRERKSYIYKVKQHEGIWKIYDYNVTNLGTE